MVIDNCVLECRYSIFMGVFPLVSLNKTCYYCSQRMASKIVLLLVPAILHCKVMENC